MSDSEKKFLIRSSGQITGPFDKKEVIDLIKRGVISIFDEVAEPFAIWQYLQDHRDFEQTVHSMDFQTRLTNFITQLSGKVSTISRTVKTTDSGTDSLGQTSGEHSIKLKSHEKQSAQEVKFEVLDQPKKQSKSYGKYTSQKDSEEIIRKKVSSIIKIIWQVMVVFALSIGAYILYKEVILPIQTKQAVSEELKTEGLNLYEAGNYKKALIIFERAYSRNILQDEEKLLLASFFLQQNKLQKADLILDELSDSHLLQSGNGFLLNGLISFFREDISKAEKYFNQALKQREEVALVNLSILKWKKGDYQRSLFYLDRLMKMGYERNITFYLKALNMLSQNQISSLADYINGELLLSQEQSLAKEYRQELYLMLAYSYMQEQKSEELAKTVNSLLNEDPFFYTEYKYSSFMAVGSLNWNYFYTYCKSIFESNSKSNLFNALYGFCYLKAGKLKQGSSYVEQAKNGAPDNPLFLSLYAYLLMLKGEDFQSEQALDLIDYDRLKQEQQKQVLPFILKARFFERRQDWARALTAWKDFLSFKIGHLSGVSGVAVTSYKLNDYSTFDVYKNRALNTYPYHVNLLSIER